MEEDLDYSEHETGNLLVAVRRPLEAVTPEFLRTLLPPFIPVPFTLRKTGLSFANGPTIVQLPLSIPFAEARFETEQVIVEPERFVYLPPQRVRVAEMVEPPTWGVVETGVKDSAYTGAEVAVAVLDSGLDFQHPDFIGRVAANDWIDLTGTGIDDNKGHGTYCAGIACGPINPQGMGRYGVAEESRLLIGKIFDENRTRCPDFDVLAGILWAAARGADIISLSWGMPTAQGEKHSKIYELVARMLLVTTETIIVAATGNGSRRPLDPRPIFHPADCPSIIAVAGLYDDLTVWRGSCGKVGNQRLPALSAPAADVISSIPRRNAGTSLPYAEADGTSASAAFVAGIAALWAEQSGARGKALSDLIIAKYKKLQPPEDVGSGLSIAP